MSRLYESLVRPLLFAQDSETIHQQTLRALGRVSRSRVATGCLQSLLAAPRLPVHVLGLKFPNPVGLAAGMDKYGEAVPAWAALGFGFCELGGVTAHAQPGNPKPRLFRAVPDGALVNAMGFNNPGAGMLAATLAEWKQKRLWPHHPVGINLGKSKATPLENAPEDYAASFQALRSAADFFVVNVSSPNTPNLRQLQDKSALDEILAALQQVNHNSAPVPILVKVAPDLSFDALDDILELAGPRQLAGIVATNTTITRPETSDAKLSHIYAHPGGLSGTPLRARSTEMVRHLFRQTRGQLPIIGVGGISDAASAWEKIIAGASLLQVYTGLIYKGPGLARSIVTGLKQRMQDHGFTELSQAVGIAARAD